CHAVVSHRFAPFKIIVWITITLPDKPMALTILPNLHHVLRLYRVLLPALCLLAANNARNRTRTSVSSGPETGGF
ncbi:hypothetical protein, partial [Salmonella enterica]|uniref:hypothetical protein n=1 Tax=Salmonella enterica TaxID=28901 RepID=UPI001E62BCCB